jgi:hypothetical protein
MIDLHNQLLLHGVQWIITIQIFWCLGQMAQAARQNAWEQARQLQARLKQALSTLHDTETRLEGPRSYAQYDCVKEIRSIIRNEIGIWPALQRLVFTDIVTLDDCVIALNDWNNLLRDTYEMLQEAQRSLGLVVLTSYKAYFAIQEFMYELHKVVTRCILRIGQLAQ